MCRDRAGAYAEGVRAGAPDAVQVADRWHMWHNLVEAVEKVVRQHHGDLREPATSTDSTDTTEATRVDLGDDHCGDDTGEEADGEPVCSNAATRLAARTQERFAAIHDLLAAGMSPTRISQTLHLDPKTVRRFARAASIEELLTARPARASVLDAYVAHLQDWMKRVAAEGAPAMRSFATGLERDLDAVTAD